ncbi:MAG: hypothetical protein CL944_02245 [Candidatus Diapherotrites archaeon]|uniref:Transcription factor E n=1 Tax=Candidatus Iainarchaeum sp. TaxID=3101447 RepID=A0A2D6LQ42_9ARCH|nr:hypothetical protein [Candidatus Diapherotrites archaeon]
MAKFPKKKIYEYLLVKDFLISVAGDYAIELVKICSGKRKPVTDEEIGKKLPLKITEIRTILNRLHYRGIACYQKTKNVKTGWYSYTWEIKAPRIATLILEQQVEEITKLEKEIEFEGTHAFFSAGKDSAFYPFEIAAEYGFKCPDTGRPLKAINNKKRVKDLKKKIDLMKSELTDLEKAI